MKRERRAFSKEFKTEAVELLLSGKKLKDVSKMLGVHQSVLVKWRHAHETEGADAFRGHGNRTALEEELRQTKVENRRLKDELEFLKKVSTYFVKNRG